MIWPTIWRVAATLAGLAALAFLWGAQPHDGRCIVNGTWVCK